MHTICTFSFRSDRDRVSMSGTSMACPMAAGAVALLLQRFPSYTPAQIKEQLLAEATQNAVNLRTYRGNPLPSAVDQTANRLIYTGKSRQCGELEVSHAVLSIDPMMLNTTYSLYMYVFVELFALCIQFEYLNFSESQTIVSTVVLIDASILPFNFYTKCDFRC